MLCHHVRRFLLPAACVCLIFFQSLYVEIGMIQYSTSQLKSVFCEEKRIGNKSIWPSSVPYVGNPRKFYGTVREYVRTVQELNDVGPSDGCCSAIQSCS